ncbi:MAG: hypothetical protein M1816_004555 [Peltula sp. TS41687]|nr:MAG: hypothetical protein M1816_004555 [Peltula sp. TS41687]
MPSHAVVNLEHKYIQIKELTKGTSDRGCFNAGVFLVRRRKDGAHFAQKKLHPQMPPAMMQNEIRLIASFQHRNLLKYVESFSTRSPFAASIYTEWCDLGSLDSLISAHRRSHKLLPEGFVRHVFLSLAEALAYMHYGVTEKHLREGRIPQPKARGWRTVLHRDLKPGNIFLVSSKQLYPRVVIGDFGMSIREDDPEYSKRQHGGAFIIRSPEPRCGPKADMWALGVVMQMLCQLDYGPLIEPPRGVNIEHWIQTSEAWNRKGSGEAFSVALEIAVESCQRFSPDDRLSSIDLAIALRKAFTQKPVAGKPLPEWANGWRV